MFPQYSEEFDHSLKKFESMLRTNDTLFFDTDEFEQIISYYIDESKFNLAKKALKVALEQHPDAFIILMMKAELLIIDDENESAMTLLDHLEVLEPQNEEVGLMKANLLSKLNRHEASIQLLEQLLDFCTDSNEIYSLLGVEYLLIDDYESANECYKQCVALDPHDHTALYNVVFCYDFMDQQEKAVEYLLDFIEKEPYSEIAWHQLGNIYKDLGKEQKALEAYEYALISDEYFVGAYLEKAKLLEQKQAYHKAIENYKITLQLDDPTAFVYHRIGRCFEALGENAKASQWYKKALHEDPMFDKAWMSMTQLHMKKGSLDKALHFINKAISLDDENTAYWENYALINKKLGNVSEAEYGMKRSEALLDDQADYLLADIDEVIFAEEYEEALLMLEDAHESFDNSSEVHYRLAGVYFMLNKIERSVYHLQLAHDINPEKIEVFETLFPVIFAPENFKLLMDAFDEM